MFACRERMHNPHKAYRWAPGVEIPGFDVSTMHPYLAIYRDTNGKEWATVDGNYPAPIGRERYVSIDGPVEVRDFDDITTGSSASDERFVDNVTPDDSLVIRILIAIDAPFPGPQFFGDYSDYSDTLKDGMWIVDRSDLDEWDVLSDEEFHEKYDLAPEATP